jgi:stage III sporulation protein SpoIIIAA
VNTEGWNAVEEPRSTTTNLDLLLDVLPPHLQTLLCAECPSGDYSDLLEIVMDLGRLPEARFRDRTCFLAQYEVTHDDLAYVTSRLGVFGDDNRAGIPRTLHRISAIRNRSGQVIGLTCRVGRAIFGTISIIRDLVESGQSMLLLGRPGVGKTTLLRETARVLADELDKRVIIVDTSNEIAGDGDIPHPAIGRARRMQVPRPAEQHAVMIEAVENHMPEVIVIDEIGNELEALAARTIAERGVQLIGTAHGNTLDNLMLNPSLSDLIGGIQAVTLGDEEARNRGTQKTVLERRAPPTFDVLVEIQSQSQVAVYSDVAAAVDARLRNEHTEPELRVRGPDNQAQIVIAPETRRRTADGTTATRQRTADGTTATRRPGTDGIPATRAHNRGGRQRLFLFGISSSRVQEAINELKVPVFIVSNLAQATAVFALKNHYQPRAPWLRQVREQGVPIYVLENNTKKQIIRQLQALEMFDQDGIVDHHPANVTR